MSLDQRHPALAPQGLIAQRSSNGHVLDAANGPVVARPIVGLPVGHR